MNINVCMIFSGNFVTKWPHVTKHMKSDALRDVVACSLKKSDDDNLIIDHLDKLKYAALTLVRKLLAVRKAGHQLDNRDGIDELFEGFCRGIVSQKVMHSLDESVCVAAINVMIDFIKLQKRSKYSVKKDEVKLFWQELLVAGLYAQLMAISDTKIEMAAASKSTKLLFANINSFEE